MGGSESWRGRARGDWLVEEIAGWRSAGLTDVICLLEDTEVRDLGLELEAQRAREAGLRFERFPIPDRGVPASAANARALWTDLADRLRAGRSEAFTAGRVSGALR